MKKRRQGHDWRDKQCNLYVRSKDRDDDGAAAAGSWAAACKHRAKLPQLERNFTSLRILPRILTFLARELQQQQQQRRWTYTHTHIYIRERSREREFLNGCVTANYQRRFKWVTRAELKIIEHYCPQLMSMRNRIKPIQQFALYSAGY